MSPLRFDFEPEVARALAKIVRRAQRGLNRRRAAERELEVTTWRERLIDANALLDQVEACAADERAYVRGAAQIILDVTLLDDPRDPREAAAKQRAIHRVERRFARLTGECLACVAEERWRGDR